MRPLIPIIALVAALSAACSSGGDGGTSAATTPSNTSSSSTSTTTPTTTPTTTWTPLPAVPGTVNVVSSDSTIPAGSTATFGQIFPVGEIASGQFVVASRAGSALPTQTVVKRRHPDGSVLHAIVSVRLPAAAATAPTNASMALTLAATASNATGTALLVSDVTASGSPDYRVEITEKSVLKNGTTPAPEAGRVFSSSLKAALAGSTDSWISGPIASEWRARVAPNDTSAVAHPGLRVSFDARYYSASDGRLSVAIENVESTPARGDRQYDLKVLRIEGGSTSVVYSRNDIKHFAQTRFRNIFYFGTGKEILAIPDSVRMKLARAIPNYANITIPAATLSSAYTSWLAKPRDVFESGIITKVFGTTGGRGDIGPLPEWAARAFISSDPRMYQIMLDSAERAAYFRVHYNEFNAPGLFSIDTHPTVNLNEQRYNNVADRILDPVLPVTSPSGWSVDRAHQPSLAYAPYLVTGDRYYLDELCYWANYNFIADDANRDGANGRAYDQMRGIAWILRTLGHAAWATPDDDIRKAYFTSKLEYNFAWIRVNILPKNQLGYWSNPLGESGQTISPYQSSAFNTAVNYGMAPWQHNFVTIAIAEMAAKGYDVTDIRDFALGFTTRLFTSAPTYSPYDGTKSRIGVRLGDGTFIGTMVDLNFHNFGTRPTVPTQMSDDNPGDANGYTAIALATIAAAVDASIPNAPQAYIFVRNQMMADAVRQNAHTNQPTWNIIPFGSVAGLAEQPGVYVRP